MAGTAASMESTDTAIMDEPHDSCPPTVSLNNGDGIDYADNINLREHQLAMLRLLTEFDRICSAFSIPYLLFAGTMLGAVRHQGFIPWDDDIDVVMLRRDYDRFLGLANAELDCESFFLQKEFSEHWPMFFSKLRLNGTTCLEKYHPRDVKTHQGVYIDIFPCDNASNSEFIRRLQFACSKVVIAKALYKRGYETHSVKKRLFMYLCRFLPTMPFLRLAKLEHACGTKYVHTFFGGSKRYGRSVYSRRIFETSIPMPFENRSFRVTPEYDELLTILYGDYMRIPPVEDRKCKEHALLVDIHRSYEEYEHYRDGMVFEVPTISIR